MQIREGEGWRLVVDPDRQPYPALIGGLDWALELDSTELSCLRRGVLTLIRQHQEILPCLMDEEQVELELDLALAADTEADAAPVEAQTAEAGSLFLALDGNSDHWALRFVLTPANGSRAAEGAWGTAASAALAAALEGLDSSGLGAPPGV